MTAKIKVGQKLFVVCYDPWNSESRELTVGRVGRKWASFEGRFERFDVKTLEFEWKYPKKGIFFSEADYVLSTKKRELWDRIRKHVREKHLPLESIGVDQLEAIAETLGA